MGYMSARAALSLWLLGLIITGTVIYFVYSAAIQYLPTMGNELLASLLFIAGVAILAFWAFVLARAVLSDKSRQ